MDERKEPDGYPLNIKDFLPWLEDSFAEKYEQSLHGVKERFLCIFSLFRALLAGFVEISDLVCPLYPPRLVGQERDRLFPCQTSQRQRHSHHPECHPRISGVPQLHILRILPDYNKGTRGHAHDESPRAVPRRDRQRVHHRFPPDVTPG